MKNQLGNTIRSLRKKLGITQSELAAKLGISSSAVGMYEQGRREPDNNTILKLCSFFGITSDYLLGNEAENSTKTNNPDSSREVSEVFDEFTQTLLSQQCLMFDGIPLNDEDRGKIVDAINVVKALINQQHRKPAEG